MAGAVTSRIEWYHSRRGKSKMTKQKIVQLTTNSQTEQIQFDADRVTTDRHRNRKAHIRTGVQNKRLIEGLLGVILNRIFHERRTHLNSERNAILHHHKPKQPYAKCQHNYSPTPCTAVNRFVIVTAAGGDRDCGRDSPASPRFAIPA